MKLTRRFTLALALLVLPGAAFANGPGGRGPGDGAGERGGPGGGGPGGPHGGGLVIAPDGKALVTERVSTTSGTTTTVSHQLTAISANGTKAWTYTAASAFGRIVTTDGIVVLNLAGDRDAATTTSQLVALNLTTGAQAWTLSVDGSIGDIEGVTGGVLIEVRKVTPATGTTAASVARSLQLVNTAGVAAWTVSLN